MSIAGLERGLPSDRTPINRLPGSPEIGLTESLNAPGIDFAPPLPDNTQELAQGLITALGIVDDIGQAAVRLENQKRRIEAETQRADEGLAIKAFRESAPGRLREIAERKRTVPDGESVEDFVHESIDNELAAGGFSEAYKEQFRSVMGPALIEAFHQQQHGIQQDARRDLATLYGWRATEAKTPGDVDALVTDAMQKLDISRTEALSTVVLPAMRNAAARGDRAQWEALSSYVGDGLPNERTQTEAALVEAENRQTRETNGAFLSSIDAMYNRGDSYQSVRESIRGREKDLDPTIIRSALDEVDRREQAANSAAARAMRDSDEEAKKAAIRDAYRPVMAGGREAGGGASNIQTQEIELVDGTKIKYTAEDIVNDLTEERFEAIDKQYPPQQDPALNIAAKTEFLSANGGVTWGPWEGLLGSGPGRITIDADNVTIDPNTVAALELWRSLGNAPRVRDRHVRDDDTRRFYDQAEFILENIPGTTPSAALVMAVKGGATAFSTEQSKSVPNGPLDKAAKARAGDNGNYVKGWLEQTTRALMAGPGRPPFDKALQHAGRLFDESHTNVQGQWIRTRGEDVPADIDPIADLILEDAVASHPELGLAREDVALVFDGTWRVAEKVGSVVGMTINEIPPYSTDDLRVLSARRAAVGREQGLRAAEMARMERQAADASERFSGLPGMIQRAAGALEVAPLLKEFSWARPDLGPENDRLSKLFGRIDSALSPKTDTRPATRFEADAVRRSRSGPFVP